MQRRKMQLKDKIMLDPLEKYVKYNKFPWKLVINLLLIIFTTVQVLVVMNSENSIRRGQYQVWKNILLQMDEEGNEKNFYNIKDFQEHLLRLPTILKELNSHVFQMVDTRESTYEMQVYYKKTSQYILDLSLIHI
eukprot:TRINITY_DN4725_c0_g1_i3.p1 TRINITY_DN4725_c0_g1~~TRINITY_DN4725_c0_g1_i3.p1  ORF type:complete len:135 (-),score=40.08 TRINITY_DN4725_c0_g1_i3:60-464(-)